MFVELQKEYGGLIVYYAQKINARTKYYGEDLEDCIQQCWIVFLKAVKNYDISSGHTFTAFLVSCLTHLMINSIRDLVRKRENIQVVSISLDLTVITYTLPLVIPVATISSKYRTSQVKRLP